MDNLNSIIDLMGSSSVSEDVILSYKGQSLKLNNSQDGRRYYIYNLTMFKFIFIYYYYNNYV